MVALINLAKMAGFWFGVVVNEVNITGLVVLIYLTDEIKRGEQINE